MTTVPNAHSPRAVVLSVLLHGLIALVVLTLAWWSNRPEEETPQIFELVAGEGNDYAALEAPTTAAPPMPTVKVDLPDPTPVITPAPTPPTPTPPAPKIERAPEPKPVPKTETPPPPKKVEKKAETPPPPKKVEVQRTTFDSFRKAHGEPKAAAPRPAPKITPRKINAESIAGRVAADSSNAVKAGAGGTALTRPEADLWAAYQAMIVQRIRRAMAAAGVTDLRSARVEFRVSAQGTVSAARITGTSGSGDFDAAVLAALRSIGQLGPPPTGQAETLSVTIELRERG